MAPNLQSEPAEPRNATMNSTDELRISTLNIEKGSDRVCVFDFIVTNSFMHLLTLTSFPSKFRLARHIIVDAWY